MPAAGTQLGELTVAYEQREQIIQRQTNSAAGLIDGDYVARLSLKVTELEDKKRTAEFALNTAQGFVSQVIHAGMVADRGRNTMETLRPPSDINAPHSQTDTLESEANALADQCEQGAEQVVQRLASGAPGGGLIVDSPQVAALVGECNSVVESIGASVESCRVKNGAIASVVSGSNVGADRLAQAESLLSQINAAVSYAQGLVEPTRERVNLSRGLRADVLQQAPAVVRQIERLMDLVTDVSVPGATQVRLKLSLLAERAAALTRFEQPHDDRLPTDAADHAHAATNTLSAARSLLESIRQAVPAEAKTADDAVARAEAAHQRALAAMLAFLSRIRPAEDDAGSLASSPNASQAEPPEPDISELGSLVSEPPEEHQPPSDREPDISELGQMTDGPANPQADSSPGNLDMLGQSVGPAPPEDGQPTSEDFDPNAIAPGQLPEGGTFQGDEIEPLLLYGRVAPDWQPTVLMQVGDESRRGSAATSAVTLRINKDRQATATQFTLETSLGAYRAYSQNIQWAPAQGAAILTEPSSTPGGRPLPVSVTFQSTMLATVTMPAPFSIFNGRSQATGLWKAERLADGNWMLRMTGYRLAGKPVGDTRGANQILQNSPPILLKPVR